MKFNVLGIAAAGLLLYATNATAGVVISPISTFNNTLGQAGILGPGNMIDQSGMSPFVSGLTDLGTYLGSSPTHAPLSISPRPGNAWATPSGNIAGSIDLDLGSNFNIDTFILWGDNLYAAPSSNSAPNAFSLTGSLVADFSASTSLGSFSGASASGNPIPAQVFNFASTNIRYVRWSIQSNHGSSNLNIGEIAFGASTQVPEPGMLALFGLGLVGLGFARRKRAA